MWHLPEHQGWHGLRAVGAWVLLVWGAILLVEVWLPKLSLQLGRWPQGFLRLLVQADLHSPSAESLRLVALLLLIALTRVCLANVSAEFAPYLLNTISFFSALLLAYSLLGVLALLQKYPLYLSTLPQSPQYQKWFALGYVLAKTVPAGILLLVAGIFTPTQWALWLLFYSATLLGIWFKPQKFLLFPLAVVLGLVLQSAIRA